MANEHRTRPADQEGRPWLLRNLPKQPHTPKAKHTPERVIAAIKGTGGIKTVIANALKVERSTVDNYIARWAAVKEAYQEEVERLGDTAESVIISAIKAGDIEVAKWYAKTKLRHRGYAERQEHSGAEGGPIVIKGYVTVSPDDWDAPEE